MGLIVGLLKSLIRTSSFVGKEITEVVRRPGALVSLILGPFLVMALFGVGYSGQRRPLETVLVVPAEAGLPTDASFYQELVGPAVNVARVTPDIEAARQLLDRQQVDMVVVAPNYIRERFLAGEQTAIGVEYSQIDPVRDNYARFVAYRQVQELNRAIIERAVGEGMQYVVQTTGQAPVSVPPAVVAAPTRAEVRNWAPVPPSVVAYFAPAVLALVLQHMGVTLAALSLVRERLSGAMDIFRVAPVRTLEILVGKYLAYGFFNLAIATATSLLLVGVLRVPLLGTLPSFASVIALLTFASVGMGLFISTVVDSERQAVQLSMLVLLASVFFSGFVLPLDEFIPTVRYLAYVLPVTHGIQLLQDVMLRGGTYAGWEFWALLAIGMVLLVGSTFALRRTMVSADS